MTRCELHTEPPNDWISECRKHKSLFHSLEWANLLQESFGSEPIYLWDDINKNGTVIQLFRAGCFRVGYITFPEGGMLDGAPIDDNIIDCIRNDPISKKIHVLRVFKSGFTSNTNLDYSSIVVPETEIINLPEWQISKLPSTLRRDINKAHRNGIQIQQEKNEENAEIFYRLYSDTIRRHRGFIRYSKEYFCGLIKLGKLQSNINCLVAIYKNRIIGFLVVVIHGDNAYYLHGAIDHEYKKYCPSYLLLHDAIYWAQSEGVEKFNMMSSPPKQKSLIKYKEKWGGITRDHMTYSININPTAGAILSIVEKIYRNIVRLRV